jgi:hypothetical protein
MRSLGPYELQLMLREAYGEVNESVDDPDVKDMLNLLIKRMGMNASEILLGLQLQVYQGEGRSKMHSWLESQPRTPSHTLLLNWLDHVGPEEAGDILRMLAMDGDSAMAESDGDIPGSDGDGAGNPSTATATGAPSPSESVNRENPNSRHMSIFELKELIEACGDPHSNEVEDLPPMLPPEHPSDIPQDVITKIEDDHESGEDGRNLGGGGKARMARQQLHQVAEYAVELWNMLDDEDELPEWCQSKIAVMTDSIGKVKHHLEYKVKKPDVLRLDGE